MATSRANTNKQVSRAPGKSYKPKPGKIAANILKKAKSTGLSGIRGPNYVARAMRPGGYSEGGPIAKAKKSSN